MRDFLLFRSGNSKARLETGFKKASGGATFSVYPSIAIRRFVQTGKINCAAMV
jgi:hypothetical protein